MKFLNFFPIFVGHFCPSAFQCCQKWGTLEMKGIKNREHHACPVMPLLAGKLVISVLSKWETLEMKGIKT
jgi:hypothetical protein